MNSFDTLPDGFELKTDILLPPDAKAGVPHPLIIAYHGGGLCGGARDCYEFLSPWLPAWAARNNAVVLSPDYRLLPQASAKDIVDDVYSLWNWVQSSLNSTLAQLPSGHHVDLSRILVEGVSAGGFTAAHLALSHPDKIRAAILVYPMVDGFYERGDVKQTVIPTDLFLSQEELIDSIRVERQKKEWIVSRLPDVNTGFLISLLQDRDAYAEAFGKGDDLAPINRINASVNGTGLPGKV